MSDVNQPAIPSTQTAPILPSKPRNNRFAGRAMALAGIVLVGAGGAAVVIGGVLPWARFELFGIPLAAPGLLTWGALTMAAGLLALTYARRYPIAGIILGLGVVIAGAYAQQEAGRTTVRALLAVERAVAPVNARLAQAALPPIEPVPAIRPAQEYTGSGPLWTFWGGAALALGSGLRFAGGRLRRTCVECGTVWEADRGDSIVFCPHCGTQAAPVNDCLVCRAPLHKRDRFCWRCGTRRKA